MIGHNFLTDRQFDTVPVGEETFPIFPEENFDVSTIEPNSFEYSGFLLVVYGHLNDEFRSGGGCSASFMFQTADGIEFPLTRSGYFTIGVKEDSDPLQWDYGITDDTWWTHGISGDDLYSLAQHEVGHAFGFVGSYPLIQPAKEKGFFDNPEILEYQGATVPLDLVNHTNPTIDKVSQLVSFGSFQAPVMETGRRISTKLDLVIMQVIGHELRETTPFSKIEFVKTTLINGIGDDEYIDSLTVTGGIPIYNWEIESGELPDGLSLNSFNGTISGIPREVGAFNLTLKVKDYDDQTLTLQVVLNIDAPEDAELPTNLAATASSDSIVELSWSVGENTAFVIIERSLDSISGFEPLDTITSDMTSYLDDDIAINTEYFYRIRAGNSGGLSGYSEVIGVEIVLSAPTDFSISSDSDENFDISWLVDENITFVIIERSLDSASGFVPIDTLESDAATFTDPDIEVNTQYYYRIRAGNASGVSEPSDVISIMIVLEVPTELGATADSDTEISLSWSLGQDNSTFIIIERSSDSTSGFVPIDSVESNLATFTDQNLEASTKYFYRIQTGNSVGLSDYSDVVGVVTLEVTGLVTENIVGEFRIYPNPVSDYLFIQTLNKNVIPLRLILYDNTGRIVVSRDFRYQSKDLKLNMSSFGSGIYFLKINTDSRVFGSRIIRD